MKSLVAAIVLACALVSFGREHEVSTMYKSTPAIVGAIWSDCSEWQAISPTPFSLQPSLHACSYRYVRNLYTFKFVHGHHTIFLISGKDSDKAKIGTVSVVPAAPKKGDILQVTANVTFG